MPTCSQTASLIITSSVAGTSTNVARDRIALTCSLEAGHDGEHKDATHGETWAPGRQTVIRQDEEKK